MTPANVLVVMGVSGVGKSLISCRLADALSWTCLDADDLHSASDIATMSGGVPLDDAARWPWLLRVRAWMDEHIGNQTSAVVACSALTHSHRDALRREEVTFVFLTAPVSVLRDRVAARRGHFMPPGLLQSQLDTLQPPQTDEQAITVDASGSADDVVQATLARWSELGHRHLPTPR